MDLTVRRFNLMASSTLDHLHASVLFSSSLIQGYDLSPSNVVLAQTCLFFLSNQAVYVYPYTTSRTSQTTKPIPVLYNVKHFILLDDLGFELVVLNGSGDLVYLQIEFGSPTHASITSHEETACNITNHILLTNSLQNSHMDVQSMVYNKFHQAIYISFHGSNQVVCVSISHHPTHIQHNTIEILTIALSLDTKPATNTPANHADLSHHHDVLMSVWGSRRHPCMVYTYPSANAYIYFTNFAPQSASDQDSDATGEVRMLYRRKGVHKTHISCLSSILMAF
ncbi:hypothetical protein EON63_03110 [archaeon]|nr:MAG: hypothetical protein EON63_03110 [archaeon]